MKRRDFLKTTAAAAAFTGGMAQAQVTAAKHPYQDGVSPWPLVLNSSTIRDVDLREQIRLAADAGWDGIEPWVNDLERIEDEGGDLEALGREIRDRGLFVANIIGLWNSMPHDDAEWDDSLNATRRRMRMAAAIGSPYVAAIPAPDRADFNLELGARRYRELLRIGRDDYGITPAVEFVGFLKGVHRLGQACAIALDANDPDACIIPDTFHLWRGGSGFSGIRQLQGAFIANFHWNDVPPDAVRAESGDEVRVLPGDGALPLSQVLRDLKAIGYERGLSLELFNRELWKRDPKEVVDRGLRRMRANIAAADV